MLSSDAMQALGSRAMLLESIQGRRERVSIQELSSSSGLHPNTVRTHLDSLLAAGEIEREQAPSVGRGRPLWLYRAAVKKPSPYEMLADALVHQLGQTDDPKLMDHAAKRWADAAATGVSAVAPTDGDQAVAQLMRALQNVGFAVSGNPVGDEITITECPYASIVEAQPRVCDVHAALVTELLSRSTQPISLKHLDVWVKPGICVAHLNRADLTPVRTIDSTNIAGIGEERIDDEKQE